MRIETINTKCFITQSNIMRLINNTRATRGVITGHWAKWYYTQCVNSIKNDSTGDIGTQPKEMLVAYPDRFALHSFIRTMNTYIEKYHSWEFKICPHKEHNSCKYRYCIKWTQYANGCNFFNVDIKLINLQNKYKTINEYLDTQDTAYALLSCNNVMIK